MTDEKRKPIVCLDFDGVIHDYREGWKDGSIYGQVTPGFFEWAAEACGVFKLVIYSSRSKTDEGVNAMRNWLKDQAVAAFGDEHFARDFVMRSFEFAHEKPPAFLTIDDRCVRFAGDWADLPVDVLRRYRTWSQE